MNEKVGQKCFKCRSELVREVVWKEASYLNIHNKPAYSVIDCSNKECPWGKNVREKQLAELNYWEELAKELGVPDLKYWQLKYDRDSECFWLVVEDVQSNKVLVDEPKCFWKEPISPDSIGEALGSRLADALTWDKEGGGTRFKELITESLKLMAEEIKKERQK